MVNEHLIKKLPPSQGIPVGEVTHPTAQQIGQPEAPSPTFHILDVPR